MEKLTAEAAKKELQEIKSLSTKDQEAAHVCETWLKTRFIECVANGLYHDFNEIKEVAIIVKSTGKIEFDRRYS